MTRPFLFALLICAAAALLPGRLSAQDAAAPSPDVVPVMTLSGPLVEMRDPFAIFSPSTQTLRDLTDMIDRAAADPAVAALAVRFEQPSFGIAQAEELHAHLMRFRETGKPVLCLFDVVGVGHYLVASAADEVVVTPVGGLEIYGIAAHMYHFADMLDKIGLGAQSVATGRYKTAFEPLTEPEMTEATREQMTSLVESLAQSIAERVAAGRGMEVQAAREILYGGPYFSTGALEAGLVTETGYLDDFLETYADQRGWSLEYEYDGKAKKRQEPASLFSLFSEMSASRGGRTASGDIAVVYAVGPIVDGRAADDIFATDQVIASEDFLELLYEAVYEDDAAALVLRIDSPGGSAIASDRIWNALRTIAEEENIPVVASMGNTAASGGYYIAMGADTLFAQNTTLTGSIGVVAGRLVLGGTYEKIGVNKQMIAVGENAGLTDEASPWSEEERAIVEDIIDTVYVEFTSKAAAARGMTREDLLDLAEGRVWTGAQAVENGLADRIGTLEDAIAYARETGNLPDADVVTYPRELTFFEYIEEMFMGQMGVAAGTPRIGGANSALFDRATAEAQLAVPGNAVQTLATTLMLLHNRPGAPLAYAPVFFDVR